MIVVKTHPDGHNVRALPTFDASIVGRLVVGDEFEVLRQEGRWYQISGKVSGWMYQTSTLVFTDSPREPIVDLEIPSLLFLANHPELDGMIEVIDIVVPAIRARLVEAQNLRDQGNE